MRESLNVRAILSLLNENGLIPPEKYNELLNIPQTETNTDRIDRLVAIIPNCGHDDFLVRLIRCLRGSIPEFEAGDAHEELAESLEVALNNYEPAASVSPQEEVKSGSKEDGNGDGIVAPESVLITAEDGGDSRSPLTVQHPGFNPTRLGTYMYRNN